MVLLLLLTARSRRTRKADQKCPEKQDKKSKRDMKIVISISRNGLLKACARFIIERSEIRKKQHAFKSPIYDVEWCFFT